MVSLVALIVRGFLAELEGKAGMEAIITVFHERRQLSFLDDLLLGPVSSAEAARGHTGEEKPGKG